MQWERLWLKVAQEFRGGRYSCHGPDHWRRVERNGLLLALRTNADVEVVKLFALFHDCRRENEGYDDGHGQRGADYAATLRGTAFAVTDEQFDLFYEACCGHTGGHLHEHPTIGTCWDADRLDLGRVGTIPDPRYMSTEFGREIAAFGSIQPFLPTSQIPYHSGRS